MIFFGQIPDSTNFEQNANFQKNEKNLKTKKHTKYKKFELKVWTPLIALVLSTLRSNGTFL